MKKKLKQIITLTCLIFILLLPFFVFADSAALTKLKDVGTTKGPFEEADEYSFANIVGTVIGAFLSLLGIFFIGLLIYGGYNWMTARGDETKVEKAKKTITNAVIGLIVIVSAYVVWDFILYRAIAGTSGL